MDQINSLDQMLDNVSRLPVDEQLMLAEIIKKRIIEQRRKKLADSVKESIEEYKNGLTKTGTIDDLIKDLENEL
jgi:adenylate kinase family enzyme